MVEFIVVSVLLVLGWSSIKLVFRTQAERLNLWAEDKSTELQEDYAEVHQKILDTKAKHGKWYTMADLEKAKRNDTAE